MAASEAHDLGLCAADRATRAKFAQDLRNLTLASPQVNRHPALQPCYRSRMGGVAWTIGNSYGSGSIATLHTGELSCRSTPCHPARSGSSFSGDGLSGRGLIVEQAIGRNADRSGIRSEARISAAPFASSASSTRAWPRNRSGGLRRSKGSLPGTKAKPPECESDDNTDKSPVHQHKGLLTRQRPFPSDEGAKRLTKSQPTRVTSSRRSATIIVDYGCLRHAKGDLFDPELDRRTKHSRGRGETRDHSRLIFERSEPSILELPRADVGSDIGDEPPTTVI